jgi:predicted Zn-dependent protease
VLANHGNERVSVAFAADSGMKMAQVLAGEATPMKSQLLGLLGLGAQVGVLLPYGRTQESEADILGLDYMASAGFDPRQSVTLWENMGRAGSKNHQNYYRRIPRIRHASMTSMRACPRR